MSAKKEKTTLFPHERKKENEPFPPPHGKKLTPEHGPEIENPHSL